MKQTIEKAYNLEIARVPYQLIRPKEYVITYLTEGLENNCGSKSVKAFNELFRCEVDK